LVWPLIAQAEIFEQAAEHAKPHDHGAQHGGAQHGDAQHHPEASPFMRAALSALTNIAVAVGYGLLLAAAMLVAGRSVNWRSGLVWGGALYLAVVLAPAIGLQPVPPGVETGELAGRQVWWIATALCTAGGLAMMLLPRGKTRLYWALAGVALIVAPQLIGAPVGAPEGTAPPDLRRHFAWMVLLTTLPPFLLTGILLGALLARNRQAA